VPHSNGNPISVDAARTAVAEALRIYPDLDPRGNGPHKSSLGDAGKHHDFTTETGLDQVATALAYLGEMNGPRYSVDESYGLKHKAEVWGQTKGFAPYVSNGAMIAAMVGSSHSHQQ